MNNEQKDIIVALKVIRNVCETQDTCFKCPFFNDNSCRIHEDYPEKWKINEENPIWRALK